METFNDNIKQNFRFCFTTTLFVLNVKNMHITDPEHELLFIWIRNIEILTLILKICSWRIFMGEAHNRLEDYSVLH